MREHNCVLRCYILGCVCVCGYFFYDLKSTLITLCASDVGAHSVAPFRGQLTGVGSLLPLCGSWRASSGPQVDGKCHSPSGPPCWSLRWRSIRTFQPEHHQMAVLYTLSLKPTSELRVQMAHLWFIQQFVVSRRLDRADPSQEEHLENTERGGRQPLCAELDQRTLEKPAVQVPEFPVGRLDSNWKREREQKLTVLKRTGVRKSKLFRVCEALEVFL